MKKSSIKTMADLDKYVQENPRIDKWGRSYLMSRYEALKELFGENYAINVLNELALQQCCRPPKGARV